MPNKIRGTNISINPVSARPDRTGREDNKQVRPVPDGPVTSKRSGFKKGLLIYTIILAVIIIVILAVIVGFIIMAILQPMLTLYDSIGNM